MACDVAPRAVCWTAGVQGLSPLQTGSVVICVVCTSASVAQHILLLLLLLAHRTRTAAVGSRSAKCWPMRMPCGWWVLCGTVLPDEPHMHDVLAQMTGPIFTTVNPSSTPHKPLLHVHHQSTALATYPGWTILQHNARTDLHMWHVPLSYPCQVSNIRRACNDKSTKDMMPPGLRQRLLAEGLPGALAFVATQVWCMRLNTLTKNLHRMPHGSCHPGTITPMTSIPAQATQPCWPCHPNADLLILPPQADVLVRSEVVDNLELPKKTTLERCALEWVLGRSGLGPCTWA